MVVVGIAEEKGGGTAGSRWYNGADGAAFQPKPVQQQRSGCEEVGEVTNVGYVYESKSLMCVCTAVRGYSRFGKGNAVLPFSSRVSPCPTGI